MRGSRSRYGSCRRAFYSRTSGPLPVDLLKRQAPPPYHFTLPHSRIARPLCWTSLSPYLPVSMSIPPRRGHSTFPFFSQHQPHRDKRAKVRIPREKGAKTKRPNQLTRQPHPHHPKRKYPTSPQKVENRRSLGIEPRTSHNDEITQKRVAPKARIIPLDQPRTTRKPWKNTGQLGSVPLRRYKDGHGRGGFLSGRARRVGCVGWVLGGV